MENNYIPKVFVILNVIVKYDHGYKLPVTVLPLASVTTTVSTVVGTVAVTGLPLASKKYTEWWLFSS